MALNRKQLLTLWVGIGAGVLTLLYPVCAGTGKNLADSDFATVHQYLYSWPLLPVDYGRTLFQLGIVALLTVGALVSFRTIAQAEAASTPARAGARADVTGPAADAI